VVPMMRIDSALCAYDPHSEAPDDLPDSLGDLLVRVEEVLAAHDADRQHLAQLTFGQNPRAIVWGPNSGLQDETLGRVFDFLTGDDGVMFHEMVLLPLTEKGQKALAFKRGMNGPLA